MSNEATKTNNKKSGDGSCKLVFKNYYVQNIEFNYNEQYKPKSGVPIEFKMSSDIEFVTENEAKVKLLLLIFDDAEINNKPFEMHLSIVGNFSVKDYKKDDKMLLEQNTLSILFPYARAIVSTYTAGANVAPLILPPINIVEYMKDKQKAQANKNNMN